MDEIEESDLVNMPRFAELAGIPLSTLWRRSNAGRLPRACKVVGRQQFWTRAQVDQWIEANR